MQVEAAITTGKSDDDRNTPVVAESAAVALPLPRRIPSADPRVRSADFGGEPGQVVRARRWVGRVVDLDDDRVYPVLLVLSEFQTNAITHTASGLPGGRVRVDLTHLPGSLRLAVTDQGPLPGQTGTCPRPRGILPGEDIAEHGRGLALVQAVSRNWGYYRSCGAATTVWALFDRDPRRGG